MIFISFIFWYQISHNGLSSHLGVYGVRVCEEIFRSGVGKRCHNDDGIESDSWLRYETVAFSTGPVMVNLVALVQECAVFNMLHTDYIC